MDLSICIPTYNRITQLDNCLNSILIASKYVTNFSFEVCVSDNGTQEDVSEIIKKYENKIHINFNKNEKNLGFALNAIKSVSMGTGKYAWMIGNDDLLMPETLLKLKNIFQINKKIDFFFINSYHLDSTFIEKFSHPFDTSNLRNIKMKKISSYSQSKEVAFWEIIDPKVSWEFLIGIFLSIFEREKWLQNVKILNAKDLQDTNVWSNFDNTCLNAKIIARTFKNSKAFICSEPLSVNLFGKREWGSLYEFVEIVRIPELIDYYREEGLPYLKYIYCKNFALRNFFNYFFKILIGGKKSGLEYINFKNHFLKNLIFPNSWLSILLYFYRKLARITKYKKKNDT
tara:strand:- start:1836 stop:2864 length:1029 start_codon:yes stop_codon:yes gene_type:complete